MANFIRRTPEGSYDDDVEFTSLTLDGTSVVERNMHRDVFLQRSLPDERAARVAYYQRIGELAEVGYQRRSPLADDLVTDELPFPVVDDAARAVYRDWLLERGDPRGELAALRAAATPDMRAISALEEARGLELFGLFAMMPARRRGPVTFAWRDGWIDDIVIRSPNDIFYRSYDFMHAAIHAPMARFAETVAFDQYYRNVIDEVFGACGCLARLTVREQG